MERGQLPASSDRLQVALMADLTRLATHQLMETSQKENRASKGNRPIRIDVLIVDRSLYFRIELRGELLQVFPLVEAQHPPGDVTLITTRAVIAALADLNMTIPEAASLKLLEIEGDQTLLPAAEIPIRD
jgi:hypothetical protein